MANCKSIDGKDLIAAGFPQGKPLGLMLEILEYHYRGKSKKFRLDLVQQFLLEPAFYRDHPHLGPVAAELLKQKSKTSSSELHPAPLPFTIFGRDGIDASAVTQMETAMRLPVTVAGSLMPDAHHGYGLPIGGVLATENAVIPYGVGVDIGCRMCLSVFPESTAVLQNQHHRLRDILLANTRFGQTEFSQRHDHQVLESKAFREIHFLKNLKDRAWRQLGTSGGGNHFVEFGELEVNEPNGPIPAGKYLSLLTHSGSRGLGAEIARYFTQLAMQQVKLPAEARHLAWLGLDTAEGQEYWQSMLLAGDYASANHHLIHRRIAAVLASEPLAMVENHHNFAWKEKDDSGRELIVHRKGATPAGKNILGIIPGSMTSPGFVVRGKGNPAALNSAAHGAGRQMSRRQALRQLKPEMLKLLLEKSGVELIGSGLDEAPMVYKDIHQVMQHQQDLVEVIARFQPRIVRMDGPLSLF